MTKKYKPFEHPRWRDNPLGITTGYREVTLEERIEAAEGLYRFKILTREECDEKIKKLKEEYSIKDAK